jgi:hypothetical protein
LRQLNESQCHGKFGWIKTARRRLIGNSPNILQDFNWQLGSSKKLHGLRSTDISSAFDIGSSKETTIVRLLRKGIGEGHCKEEGS